MAGMPEMQEHFPAHAMDGGYAGMQEHFSAVPGWHECRKRRSFFFGAWMALCVHAEPELF